MAGVVVVDHGLLSQLDALRPAWLNGLRAGLFQNDWEPQRHHTLAQVQPASFSGYAGLLTLNIWSAAVLLGEVAYADAQVKTWTHNGGAIANWIFGYYVVDLAGSLVWAERSARAPELVGPPSPIYQVTPRYGLRSRFPA